MKIAARERLSLSLSSVVEPATVFWYEEEDYVRLIHSRAHREILLTKCAKSIWELLVNDELTAQQIIDHLQHRYSKELIMVNVETMVKAGFVTIRKDFLWQEE